MEYHIDRVINFVPEEEFKTLYSWSLQEAVADGRPIGEKQVPWPWRMCFAARDMAHTQQIEATLDFNKNPRGQTSSESIVFSLIPDGEGVRAPSFSMFGTERSINHFRLTVRCLKDGSETQTCYAWGVVSYTAEFDFRYDTVEDSVGFELLLSPQNFENLRLAAQSGMADHAVAFTVSSVDGFYAPWSPSISARKVKVLASRDQQPVILPHGVGEVPRLAQIQDFSLSITRRGSFASKPVTDDVEEERVSTDRQGDELGGQSSILAEVARLHLTMTKLRIPLWLIVALLAVLLAKS